MKVYILIRIERHYYHLTRWERLVAWWREC